MADINKLVYQIMVVLEKWDKPPGRDELVKLVNAQATVLSMAGDTFNEEEIETATRTIESRFDISMEMGSVLEADYHPWLDKKIGEIVPYYWDRYCQYLLKKNFPPKVIRSLGFVTHKILDRLEDPEKPGKWARKGMVVGHVQSGKTANYNGLICKAADAGYKVIIVLAGLTNSLRNQTQSRLDHDFRGWCSVSEKKIGAGDFDDSRRPVSFTTSISDFKKSIAKSVSAGLEVFNEPVVLVIKKHSSTMKNLYDWLDKNNKYKLKDFPMLLIDDEADHASIRITKLSDICYSFCSCV